MPTENDADDKIVDQFIDRREVLRRIPVTHVTLWNWQQVGKFPRSRDIGGKSVWLEAEVEAWIRSRPIRPLKGDANPPPPNNLTRRRTKKVA